MVVHKAQTGHVSGKWGQSSCSWGGNGWLLTIPPIRGGVIHTETTKCKRKVFVIVVDWVRATMWRFWSFNLRASALSLYGTLNSKYTISSLFKNACVCTCVLCVYAPVCVCLPVGSWKLAPGIFQNSFLPYLLSQCLPLNPEITYWLDLLAWRANLPHQFQGYRDAWHAWTLQRCWGVRT